MNDLPEPVCDLLAAIADSLDLPLPDLSAEDERIHALLLRHRTSLVHNSARFIVTEDHAIESTTRWIREETARRPVTYAPWEPKTKPDGGQA